MSPLGRRGEGRRVVVVAASVTVTGILANTLVAPVLPDIEEAFGASPAELGAVVTLASLPGIVLAPVIGLLADRFGRRSILVPCLAVFGAGGVAAMAAPTLVFLLGARLVQGAGGAGLVNLAVVILGDTFDGEIRARAIGRNAAVLTSGLAVLPLIGGTLSALGGWRLAFAPYALAFVVAIAVARILPHDRPTDAVVLTSQLRAARPYLTSLSVVAMVAAGFCSFVIIFGLGLTALPLHLDREFGLGAAGRGLVLGLPALASVVVSLRMGRLTARFGTWPLVIIGFVVFAVALFSVATVPVFGLVLVAVVLFGVGEGLTFVPLQTYATEIAPAAHRGIVVAVLVAGARGGQSTGPISTGSLIGATNTDAAFFVGSGFAASVALALGGSRARARNRVPRPRSGESGGLASNA